MTPPLDPEDVAFSRRIVLVVALVLVALLASLAYGALLGR